MEHKWKKLFSYYKPYKKMFAADLFFAILAATVTLVVPLIVRYITGTVIFLDKETASIEIAKLGIIMVVLVLIECYSNFYIANYGHVMAAKI